MATQKLTLRIATAVIANAIAAVSHTRYFWFSPQYSPSHAARSLTAHDRAKCPRRRARSFDEGIIKSREKRGFARRETQPCQQNATSRFDFLIRLLGNPKITLRINPRAFALQTVRGFSYSLFLVFPSILPFPRGTLAHRSRPRKVPSSKSAVIRRGHNQVARRKAQHCQKNATSRFDFWCADNDMMLNSAASTRPPFRLSLKSTPSASKPLADGIFI